MLKDEEFQADGLIKFKDQKNYLVVNQSVWLYTAAAKANIAFRVKENRPHVINVEFQQKDVDGGEETNLVDMFFEPEDLERLGVLLQYEAKKYMQLRDEAVAAKLKKDQEQKQSQPRKGSILR